jgi:putative SOS response-associated peptidase YedK
MCGRFVTTIPPENLARLFALVETPHLEPRYNVSPAQMVPVVRSTGDHNVLVPMKWGLIPTWSKDPAMGSHMINARCETVTEKPAFRHAIKYNRCIIPTSGFYEWKPVEHHKDPYFITMVNHAPMCFAGLWEQWHAPDSSVVETFSILTTGANSLVAPIHDRMPVILNPDDFSLWLNRNMHDPHELERVYQSFPAERMAAYQVPNAVNNPKFDSPACIIRV